MKKKQCVLAGSLAISLGVGALAQDGVRPRTQGLAAQSNLSIEQAAGVLGSGQALSGSRYALGQVGVPQPPAAAAPGPAAGAAAAAAPQPNVFSFLGFPPHDSLAAHKEKLSNTPLGQAIHKLVTDPILNMVGLGSELAPVDAPENLASPVPAVKSAAEVKQQEDAVPQKVQALRYLAQVENACCYPGVSQALLDALNDCNEKVRYEAAKALGESCCCHPENTKRLQQVVEDRDELGLYKERSARVRQAAMHSISVCSSLLPPEREREVPEGPQAVSITAEGSIATSDTRSLFLDHRSTENTSETNLGRAQQIYRTPRVPRPDWDSPNTFAAQPLPAQISLITPRERATNRGPKPSNDTAMVHVAHGTVAQVNTRQGTVTVSFPAGVVPPLGSRIEVFHRYLFRRVSIGEMVVEEAKAGTATARPVEPQRIRKISKGDQTVLMHVHGGINP